MEKDPEATIRMGTRTVIVNNVSADRMEENLIRNLVDLV